MLNRWKFMWLFIFLFFFGFPISDRMQTHYIVQFQVVRWIFRNVIVLVSVPFEMPHLTKRNWGGLFLCRARTYSLWLWRRHPLYSINMSRFSDKVLLWSTRLLLWGQVIQKTQFSLLSSFKLYVTVQMTHNC